MSVKSVLVCGGREFTDYPMLETVLDSLAPEIVIHGACSGTDDYARVWAELHGVPHASVPANWKWHGKAAGPLRNEAMLLLKPDLVVAMPGGSGTADMVRRARKAGIPVHQVQKETK